ncbi:hypothetical protein [Paenibacillus durus]|uniref:Uncharacterized protein n=1 Tax=Paenibacillus durus ATCC 35681 TaxID=1333534 RepID=A0A0F7FAJ7_PAEDU|nr:hypothetical protein [Paenibacillus durus]AKG35652.1 hypothetical protein VK70_14600 [Paenibacillus durus ATCC 35681]
MEPGEGAVEYARELTEGLTPSEARLVIRDLLKHPPAGPKIKRCAVCSYYFRDRTRPGNAKVCGPSCKTVRKTEQRADQRARQDTDKPNKPRRYDTEAYMRRLWNYEKPYDPDKLAQIYAARERARLMGGGRKKPIRRVDY